MSTKVVGHEVAELRLVRLEEEELRRLDGRERARNARARSQRASLLDGEEGSCVVRVERVAIGVRDQHVGCELANSVGDRDERVPVDLERIVAEIQALELCAERGRRSLRLAVPDLLHALDGLSLLLPELAGLAALAIGEREHACRSASRGRDRDRAARAPDEVRRVRADHEELSRHDAPASRLDCVTISSRVSSSSNPAPRSRSAQSARPSSTGG